MICCLLTMTNIFRFWNECGPPRAAINKTFKRPPIAKINRAGHKIRPINNLPIPELVLRLVI